MDDDYDEDRRRQANEIRRKREEERQEKRAKLGMSTSRQKPSGVSVGSDPKTDETGSPDAQKSRKRNRADSNRFEKLTEDKRVEDGVRLIQKLYGTTYLKSSDFEDDLIKDDTPVKQRSGKQSAKTICGDISPPLGGVIISNDLKAAMKSASRSSVESRNCNEQNHKAKSTNGWQTTSSISTQKKAAAPAKPRQTLHNNGNSSSDSDEDLVALFLEQKRKLSPSQRMNASLKSNTSAKLKGGDNDLPNTSPEQRRINNFASSDEDLTKITKKDNYENRKDAYCNDSNGEQDSSPNSESKRGRKATKKPQNDSESDEEDLVSLGHKILCVLLRYGTRTLNVLVFLVHPVRLFSKIT